MDKKDRRILELIQGDAMLTAAEIAEQVGLTTTPCWRRIQKLEAAGYIRARVTLLDRQKMNVGITVFVSVRTSRHADDWLGRFMALVRNEKYDPAKPSGAEDAKTALARYRGKACGVEYAEAVKSFEPYATNIL